MRVHDQPVTGPLRSAIKAELERGFTVTELAERFGMPRPNLTRFVTGEKVITTETADRIAAALGLEVKKRRKP